jgi:predicted DNA-binding protein
MPFSLRLDPDTEALIRRLSADTGRSRAAVVREAVAQYSAMREGREAATQSAYDRLKQYVGIASSGGADFSVDTHRKYRESLRRKYGRASRSR